ncbi:MAG: hypothetical protein ACRCSN_02710, partial [Dermatophilaceae bacterium]
MAPDQGRVGVVQRQQHGRGCGRLPDLDGRDGMAAGVDRTPPTVDEPLQRSSRMILSAFEQRRWRTAPP